MVKAIYLNKEVMLKMLNLHDRDWKEFYIKDIFFINPGKRDRFKFCVNSKN